MQNFLSKWLNAGAQITHGGQVQRSRQLLIPYFNSTTLYAVVIVFRHTKEDSLSYLPKSLKKVSLRRARAAFYYEFYLSCNASAMDSVLTTV